MAWNVNLGLGEHSRRGSRHHSIDALSVVLDLGVGVESVPLPSEDDVLTGRQVRWDGDIVVVAALAVVLLPDFEPLLVAIGLVSIIGKVDEAIADVRSGELKSDALRLTSAKVEPVSTGHVWVASAYEVGIIGIDGGRSILLVCVSRW